jgi:hypothetical protein
MKTQSLEQKKVFSLFGANGATMQEIKPMRLPMYCKVYYFGYGHEGTELAVISEPDQHGNYKLVYMNDYKHGFKTMDKYSRPLSEKFGIGLYYSDTLEVFEANEVSQYIGLAITTEAEAKTLQEAKDEADTDEKNNLPKLYPHLTVNTGDDQKITKNNIVATLKKEFPTVKFSVRKDYYSSYTVNWVDGPTADEVDKKINIFISYENDETGDFRDPAYSNFNRVFGGLKYLSTTREPSPELEPIFKSFVENMEERFWLDQPQELTYLPYKIFRRNSIPIGEKVIGIEEKSNFSGTPEDGYKFIFEAAEPTETPNFEPQAVKAGEIQIIDYSERAIAVIGDTKPIKDQLKEIGGKFNFRLSCGAGWIFSKKQLPEVEKLLSGTI